MKSFLIETSNARIFQNLFPPQVENSIKHYKFQINKKISIYQYLNKKERNYLQNFEKNLAENDDRNTLVAES